MTALCAPSLDLYDTWAETVREFVAEGDRDMAGSGNWNLPDHLAVDTSRETCAMYVDLLAALGTEEASSVDAYGGHGRVPSDYRWITDTAGPAAQMVGFIAVRHRLNDFLLNIGGHIGYSIRPSRRREGHATRALGLALGRCRELGLSRALVTCDDTNAASAATIERCGGVLEDKRPRNDAGDLTRRYWIELGSVELSRRA